MVLDVYIVARALLSIINPRNSWTNYCRFMTAWKVKSQMASSGSCLATQDLHQEFSTNGIDTGIARSHK